MRTRYSDEQDFLRDAVRGAIERHVPLSAVRAWALDEPAGPDSPVTAALEQGWAGIGVDEDAGGEGGGVVERAIVAEELGRSSVPDGALQAAAGAALALARCGATDLAREALAADGPPMLAADLRRPIDRPAAAEPAGPIELDYVHAAAAAATRQVVLVPDGRGGAEVWLVAGAERTVRERALVDRTRPLAAVRLSGGERRPVGGLDAAALCRLAAEQAVLLAADALGAAQWLLDTTVAYVRDRRQFGVPVGSFQAVKHAAAQMLVPIEATRAATQYAAWALDAGDDDALLHAWIARAYAADQLGDVADKALFLHGAIGYTWEHDLQLPFKRIKADAQLLGPAGGYHDRVAAAVGIDAAAALPA